MKLHKTFLATAAIAVAMFFAGIHAGLADDVVARFEGTTQANVGGQPVTVVGLTLMSTGKTAKIPVPNAETKPGEKAVPKPELDAAIKKLTAGQFVKFSVEPSKTMGQVLSSIDPYELKPGEDTPNGYVFSKTFDKTVGKNSTTTVVLTKFGVEHSFSIVMRKGDSGQEQDPDVVAALAKLTEGAGVWVQVQGKSIATIEPYSEPQTGKIGKVEEKEIDGHKVKSADIETDGGKTVTVMVPGKEVGKAFVLDSAILSQLTKMKAGGQVQFRTHDDGENHWLREIQAMKAAPKPPVEKEKPPAKK